MSMTSTPNDAGLERAVDPGDGDSEVAVAWTRLSVFKVTVKGRDKIVAPVYKNARQRIPCQVEIVALNDNDEEVTLTNSQLNEIHFIVYETGKTPNYFGRYTVNNKFEYGWNVEPALGADGDGDVPNPELRDPSVRGQLVTFFLQYNVLGTVKIAATITSPSGAVYTTNTPNPDPGDNWGKFDSWVIIDARAPMVHHWQALELYDRTDIITEDKWDIDLYTVRFNYATGPNYRILESIHHNHVADEPFYAVIQVDFRLYAAVAFRAGDRRSVKFSQNGAGDRMFDVNQFPGQANVARLKTHGSLGFQLDRKDGYVTYIDQFGNPAPARIAASENGNTLSLVSTGPHQ